MIIKSISQIAKIDTNGITFNDGKTLRFLECVETFQSLYPNSNSTCVAERDITAKPPFFEFFTADEHIKVIFDGKGLFSKSKNRKAFHDFQKQILGLGFTTYDLS